MPETKRKYLIHAHSIGETLMVESMLGDDRLLNGDGPVSDGQLHVLEEGGGEHHYCCESSEGVAGNISNRVGPIWTTGSYAS